MPAQPFTVPTRPDGPAVAGAPSHVLRRQPAAPAATPAVPAAAPAGDRRSGPARSGPDRAGVERLDVRHLRRPGLPPAVIGRSAGRGTNAPTDGPAGTAVPGTLGASRSAAVPRAAGASPVGGATRGPAPLGGGGPFGTAGRVGTVTALPGAAAGGPPGGHAGLAIDRAAWSAWLDGEPLDLTYLEFEVLDFLVRHPGRVYSRGALLHQVWGHTLADDPGPSGRTVDVLVTRLRRKLGPQHRGRIETVRRVGYRYRPDAADDLRWCHG